MDVGARIFRATPACYTASLRCKSGLSIDFSFEKLFMKYQAILYETHGAVAKVITNRPRYKNAQSRVMIEEMDHAFAAACADEDIRVIILAAAGDTFSSGHDIGTPEE